MCVYNLAIHNVWLMSGDRAKKGSTGTISIKMARWQWMNPTSSLFGVVNYGSICVLMSRIRTTNWLLRGVSPPKASSVDAADTDTTVWVEKNSQRGLANLLQLGEAACDRALWHCVLQQSQESLPPSVPASFERKCIASMGQEADIVGLSHHCCRRKCRNDSLRSAIFGTGTAFAGTCSACVTIWLLPYCTLTMAVDSGQQGAIDVQPLKLGVNRVAARVAESFHLSNLSVTLHCSKKRTTQVEMKQRHELNCLQGPKGEIQSKLEDEAITRKWSNYTKHSKVRYSLVSLGGITLGVWFSPLDGWSS